MEKMGYVKICERLLAVIVLIHRAEKPHVTRKNDRMTGFDEESISDEKLKKEKNSLDKRIWISYNTPCDCADVAQLVERLIRNHQVKGSSPFIGSIFSRCSAVW